MKKRLDLNRFESLELLEIISNFDRCQNEIELLENFQNLRNLSEFKCYCFIISRLDNNLDLIVGTSTRAGTWPNEWFTQYESKHFHLIDPIIKDNYGKQGFKTLLWSEVSKKYPDHKQFFKETQLFDLNNNSVTIGVLDEFKRPMGGQFTISGVENYTRSIPILEFVTPYIYRAMLRIRAKIKQNLLTTREQEVLSLVSNGLKQEFIAEDCSISKRRVRQLISSAVDKLDAHNTVHAISEAQIEGIISLK